MCASLLVLPVCCCKSASLPCASSSCPGRKKKKKTCGSLGKKGSCDLIDAATSAFVVENTHLYCVDHTLRSSQPTFSSSSSCRVSGSQSWAGWCGSVSLLGLAVTDRGGIRQFTRSLASPAHMCITSQGLARLILPVCHQCTKSEERANTAHYYTMSAGTETLSIHSRSAARDLRVMV